MDPGTVALSKWVRGRIPDLPISDHLMSGYVVIGRPTQIDSGRQGCPRADQAYHSGRHGGSCGNDNRNPFLRILERQGDRDHWFR